MMRRTAFVTLLMLSGCTALPQPPGLGIDVATACKVFNIVRQAVGQHPMLGSAIAIIEGFVDPICSAAVPVARDAETGEWVLHNAAALAAASGR